MGLLTGEEHSSVFCISDRFKILRATSSVYRVSEWSRSSLHHFESQTSKLWSVPRRAREFFKGLLFLRRSHCPASVSVNAYGLRTGRLVDAELKKLIQCGPSRATVSFGTCIAQKDAVKINLEAMQSESSLAKAELYLLGGHGE